MKAENKKRGKKDDYGVPIFSQYLLSISSSLCLCASVVNLLQYSASSCAPSAANQPLPSIW